MTAPPLGHDVLLGTVAIEPNRWSTVDPSGEPVADLAALSEEIASVGADGLELWERHLPVRVDGDPDGAADAVAGSLDALPPVRVLSTYVGFDTDDPAAWRTVAERVRASGARGLKFNVGNDASSEAAYVERVATLAGMLPPDVVLICECHQHISIAEDPTVAARMLSAIGPPDRFGAIVHTHEAPDHLRARFDAYGERIHHVHVNFLDHSTMTVPVLAGRRDELEAKVALLRDLGFRGSWTLEFVEGVLTDHDEPIALLNQATQDLAVLRDVLGSSAPGG